jgi:hypothetical protein
MGDWITLVSFPESRIKSALKGQDEKKVAKPMPKDYARTKLSKI